MGKRKDLRERVQHQAYLYRVNADLRGDKIHPLVDLSETTPRADRRESKGQQVMPCVTESGVFVCCLLLLLCMWTTITKCHFMDNLVQLSLLAHSLRLLSGYQMVREENKPRTGPPDKKMLFAKSLREIESLRHRQRRRLMTVSLRCVLFSTARLDLACSTTAVHIPLPILLLSVKRLCQMCL